MTTFGIDVSHYQGEIDWFAVAGGPTKFAIAKATEGTNWVDVRFEQNWRRIREVGLFRGAYHFGRPGADPEVQAQHFFSAVDRLGFRDLPPVLDLEADDGHPPEHVLAWTRAFVARAEALFERRVMIYTGGFWRYRLGNPADGFFGERPLWLAAYQKAPVVPASWGAWTFWQYSDGTHNGPASVAGVRGPVDQNRFAGDASGLLALCSLTAPGPTTPPAEESSDKRWPGTYFVWPHAPIISGVPVHRWQARVTELGFGVDIDGIYGPQSKRACHAFQRDRGLLADGIVGRATWDACFQ
jgi:lysozyme